MPTNYNILLYRLITEARSAKYTHIRVMGILGSAGR